MNNGCYGVVRVLGSSEVGLTKITLGFAHEFYSCVLNTYCVPGSVQVVGGWGFGDESAWPPDVRISSHPEPQEPGPSGGGWIGDDTSHYLPLREPPPLSPHGIFSVHPELRATVVL